MQKQMDNDEVKIDVFEQVRIDRKDVEIEIRNISDPSKNVKGIATQQRGRRRGPRFRDRMAKKLPAPPAGVLGAGLGAGAGALKGVGNLGGRAFSAIGDTTKGLAGTVTGGAIGGGAEEVDQTAVWYELLSSSEDRQSKIVLRE